MISATQIETIAQLPQNADFRFKRQFGQTIVVVRFPDDAQTIEIGEAGDRTVFSGGAIFGSYREAIGGALRRPSYRS